MCVHVWCVCVWYVRVCAHVHLLVCVCACVYVNRCAHAQMHHSSHTEINVQEKVSPSIMWDLEIKFKLRSSGLMASAFTC